MIAEFLKAPTDNLYKFMTIFGLVLLLISVTYPPWALNKTTLSYFETQRDYDLLDIDIRQGAKRSEEWNKKADSIKAEYEKLFSQNKALENKIIEARSHPTKAKDKAIVKDFIDLKEIGSQLGEKNRQLEKAAKTQGEFTDTLQKKGIEILYKAKVAQWESRSALFFGLLAIFGSAIGNTHRRQRL